MISFGLYKKLFIHLIFIDFNPFAATMSFWGLIRNLNCGNLLTQKLVFNHKNLNLVRTTGSKNFITLADKTDLNINMKLC